MRSAIVISGLMLVAYAQAAFYSVCGSRGGFSKHVVTSLCAFASYYANPSSSVFSPPTRSIKRCNLPSTQLCSSRAFLPSVRRTQKPPAIGYESVGLTGRAAISTSSIEPRSDNKEETAIEQEQSNPSEPNERIVIIIGGTGFLGTEIRKQLQERGIQYIATTTPAMTFRKMNEKDKFVPLDLTAENAQQDFYDIVSSAVKGDGSSAKEVSVIAAMGTIGTKDDEKVNAALAEAIRGAHRVNVKVDNENIDDYLVKSFVMIGNTKRVRRLARKISFLKGYAEGKDAAEATLQDLFGKNACIIKPSFIYGGEEIVLNPPRLPTSLGGLASEVLGLYPLQALADELPDALALPLAPPISVEVVASAAINVALGIVRGYTEELEGKEAIVMAGTVRKWKEKSRYENLLREEYLETEDGSTELYISGKDSCSMNAIMEMSDERRWSMINDLKDKLLRRNGNENISDDNDLDIMEELECLRPKSMIPADDPKLNGRWNFVLSKDDLGTQLIKELLPPDYHSIGSDDEKGLPNTSSSTQSQPPWKSLLGTAYQLHGLYMRIHDEQSQVEIVLSSKLFFGKLPFEIVFSTSLLATDYDEETAGLLFLEKFEDVELRFSPSSGWKLPIPSNWQRFRHLEITYLDDEIVIARGSGGDPHVLIRAAV